MGCDFYVFKKMSRIIVDSLVTHVREHLVWAY